MALAEICAEHGQRALVGKTVMDDPAANPDYYRDASPEQAVRDTETLIREMEAIGRKSRAGAWPVITPRFIPSCTDEVLRGLGNLAESTGAYVQTHCNEGQWEHDVVLERFGKTDPYALRDFGLLREHSIMAHCPYLTEEEGEMFAELGVAVAHCPTANSYFSSCRGPHPALPLAGDPRGAAAPTFRAATAEHVREHPPGGARIAPARDRRERAAPARGARRAWRGHATVPCGVVLAGHRRRRRGARLAVCDLRGRGAPSTCRSST